MEMAKTGRRGREPGSEPGGESALVLHARLVRLSQHLQAELEAMRVGQKDRAFLATRHGTDYLANKGNLLPRRSPKTR